MYRRQQPFVPNDLYADQMVQHPNNQQQTHQSYNNHYMFTDQQQTRPASNNQHMFTNQEPMQQSMQQESPFEYFTKPQQPTEWPMYSGQENMNYYTQAYPYVDQYQSQSQNAAPSFLTQFQDENGQMSFDKVLSTVGQLANTFQQVTPVIQQVSAMVKAFR